jgi:hypothetical protein
MTDTFNVQLEWSGPDQMYAAVLVRDGEPWVLNGALVGMGHTPGEAIDDLTGIACHLVIHGENYLTSQSLSAADRAWLFGLLPYWPDLNDEMYAAVQAARQIPPEVTTT